MADYGSLQDHADAVLALLRAQPSLSVYPIPEGGIKTVPPGTQPPYVAVHFASARSQAGMLHMRSIRMVVRTYCHCVGATDIGARAVSDLVAAALLDVVPVIDGRNCAPIRHDTAPDPRVDESTGLLVATLTDVYRLESLPGRDGS